MYVDECGLDESICRDYARAPVGEKIQGDIHGKRTTRTSIIAGLIATKAIAPMYFEDYCNTDVVLTWVKEVLVPELKPEQVVIWDNASFHQFPEFTAIIEAAQCRLVYLPPYSPDLIEQYWATLKAKTQTLTKMGQTLYSTSPVPPIPQLFTGIAILKLLSKDLNIIMIRPISFSPPQTTVRNTNIHFQGKSGEKESREDALKAVPAGKDYAMYQHKNEKFETYWGKELNTVPESSKSQYTGTKLMD